MLCYKILLSKLIKIKNLDYAMNRYNWVEDFIKIIWIVLKSKEI